MAAATLLVVVGDEWDRCEDCTHLFCYCLPREFDYCAVTDQPNASAELLSAEDLRVLS